MLLVRGDIAIIAAPATQRAFKNCAPFTNCITKIDGTTIYDAEDLDLVMPIYNLIEYSSNYSETTGNLWFCLKDEATKLNLDIVNTNDFKSFKYKTKLLGSTEADNADEILNNATIAFPLRYLSNFWRSFKISLINCKVELKLKWAKYCTLSAAGADNVNNSDSDNITSTIKDTNLYVSCVNFISKRQSKTIKTS